MASRAAVRRRAVLRRPDARRDRRPRRALAGARGRAQLRAPRRGSPSTLDVAARRAAPRRGRAAARHLPLAVGSKEVDVSPALHFLRPRQVVELSPRRRRARSASRDGDQRRGRLQRHARARRRAAARRDPARLGVPRRGHARAAGQRADRRRSSRSAASAAGDAEPGAVAAQVARPPSRACAEMPPSAPLPIPPADGQSGHDA